LKGNGLAYGAVSVVNALATGFGAAIGIELPVKASVSLISRSKVETDIMIRGKKEECDLRLVNSVIELVDEKYGLEGGVSIRIDSEVPIARGLKSSSAVANALMAAFLDALGINAGHMEIIRLAVEASQRAGVTITGAFDDACASLLGGLCITNNIRMELIDRQLLDSLYVVLFVPAKQVETSSLENTDFSVIKPYVDEAFNLVIKDRWREAMVINGLIYSSFLGYNTRFIIEALEAGAVAAGLSGKGPAFTAITEDPDDVSNRWLGLGEGEIIRTRIR
jgi:shikimate kinase